jgi:hypothetical protein
MTILQMLSQAGIHAILSMIVSVLPLGAGIAYAIRPTEQRLALMRPISLAGLFGALSGLASALVNLLRGIAVSEPIRWHIVALGAAEAFVPLYIGFSCLTVGWLCVALGLRKHP